MGSLLYMICGVVTANWYQTDAKPFRLSIRTGLTIHHRREPRKSLYRTNTLRLMDAQLRSHIDENDWWWRRVNLWSSTQLTTPLSRESSEMLAHNYLGD